MWHSKDVETVLRELETGREGLDADEARRRLDKYGYNELQKQKRASPLGLFVNQFKNVLIIILLIATALSLLIGETVDALIIGVIVVFSAVLGFLQEYRAERALVALKKMLAETVTVLRGGREQEVASKEIVPGDIMVLEAGDKVPADARLVEVASMRCDEAPLTGESLPVEKDGGALPGDTTVADRKNMVYTGSIVTYGRGRAAVTATGMNTEFGRIAREVAAVKAEKTPLEKRTEEIGKWLGVTALGICLLVIGVSIMREIAQGTLGFESALTMLMFGVALAVAAVPEALTAIVTGALAIGMREMAKSNALVRKMPAVETLGCTTVICTDKTGTLTRGEMTVRKIYTSGGYVAVTGAGYEPTGEFKNAGDVSDRKNPLRVLLTGGLLCNDADLIEKEGRWAIRGDPTEAALVVAAVKAGIDRRAMRQEHPRLAEVPFSSERKRMTTVHSLPEAPAGPGKPKRYVAYVKGAPEVLLGRSTHILGREGIRPLSDEDRDGIMRANEEMAKEALRVLALGYKEVQEVSTEESRLEEAIVFVGLVGMMDPPRPEAIEAVNVCRQVRMKPVMITGDHRLTALAVAKEMGIYNDGDMALTGEELEGMEDGEFEALVDRVSVYARVSPSDKLKIVTAWKKRGEVVAMTGDGVNDAPALKHADIGIAMGITGTEVAKEAADMVLSDDNFATIVKAVERGRWIYDNIKKYLTYLLRCNVTEVLVIGGVVLWKGPEFLPLLPAAILYVNLATDGLPALALGVSPPDPDIMQRPPRSPRESVFSWDVRTFIAIAVAVEVPIFLLVFFGSQPEMELARTRMFFMFILIELAIAMNFRSMRYSVFKAPPHKWLGLALFWELVLIAVLMQLPSVRAAFGVEMPTAGDLGVIAGFGVMVFVIMEAVKAVLRRGRRPLQ
jgi:Ca2+-transporting ATPase